MRRHNRIVEAVLWLAAFAPLLGFPVGVYAQANNDLVAKGQYIFAVAGGCACHTEPKGTPHAGARAFPIPFGTVYSTNITQDKETGLGDWTDQQIHDAMVKGIRKDGGRILPVMPYEKYSGMAQEDMLGMIAYMRTLKPVKKATPALKTWAPFARSLGTPLFLQVLQHRWFEGAETLRKLQRFLEELGGEIDIACLSRLSDFRHAIDGEFGERLGFDDILNRGPRQATDRTERRVPQELSPLRFLDLRARFAGNRRSGKRLMNDFRCIAVASRPRAENDTAAG